MSKHAYAKLHEHLCPGVLSVSRCAICVRVCYLGVLSEMRESQEILCVYNAYLSLCAREFLDPYPQQHALSRELYKDVVVGCLDVSVVPLFLCVFLAQQK